MIRMKVVVFLADGFEEVEAITSIDYLRRAGLKVDAVSIKEGLEVKGAHGIVIKADKLISEVDDMDSYDGVVIPGGMPGARNLRDDERVVAAVRELNKRGKLVAAICAGPIVLHKAGALDQKSYTCFPGFEEDMPEGIYTGQGVSVDMNTITSQGPFFAAEFALAIVESLAGTKKRRSVEGEILKS